MNEYSRGICARAYVCVCVCVYVCNVHIICIRLYFTYDTYPRDINNTSGDDFREHTPSREQQSLLAL